jgi:hypothetical protein
VAPAGDDPEPRAVNVGGGIVAGRNANEGIVRPVHDQRRGADAPKRPDAAVSRLDCDEMSGPAVRMRAPAKRTLDLGAKLGVAGRVPWAADQPQKRDRLRRPRNTRGLGPGNVALPLVDMRETRLFTRSG